MERYTRRSSDGKYEITDLSKAAESLAKYEDLCEYVMDCEHKIPVELDKLRREHKEKSYRFRELMGQKLLNTSFISLLKQFGIR